MKSGGEVADRAIRLTSARDGASAMSQKATFAPWAQKCSTKLAPMPLPPPLMKTTRPARLG